MDFRDFLRHCFNRIWTQKRFWYVSYLWTMIIRILTPHSSKLHYISNFQAWSNLLFGCSSASIWIYLEIKQDVNASKGTWLRSLINLFPGKFELFSKICWGKRQNIMFGTLVHPFIRHNQIYLHLARVRCFCFFCVTAIVVVRGLENIACSRSNRQNTKNCRWQA